MRPVRQAITPVRNYGLSARVHMMPSKAADIPSSSTQYTGRGIDYGPAKRYRPVGSIRSSIMSMPASTREIVHGPAPGAKRIYGPSARSHHHANVYASLLGRQIKVESPTALSMQQSPAPVVSYGPSARIPKPVLGRGYGLSQRVSRVSVSALQSTATSTVGLDFDGHWASAAMPSADRQSYGLSARVAKPSPSSLRNKMTLHAVPHHRSLSSYEVPEESMNAPRFPIARSSYEYTSIRHPRKPGVVSMVRARVAQAWGKLFGK